MPIPMPETPATPVKRVSSSLRPYHLENRGVMRNRVNRMLDELHTLESTPDVAQYVRAAHITEGMSRVEIANDIIIMLLALVDSLDAQYPAKG